MEDGVGTVLVGCRVHLRARTPCPSATVSRHQSGGGGASGGRGHHHQRGVGGGHAHSSLIAGAGLRHSPVHSGVFQVVAVRGLVVVQDLPLLVESLPAVEDPKHRRPLVDDQSCGDQSVN